LYQLIPEPIYTYNNQDFKFTSFNVLVGIIITIFASCSNKSNDEITYPETRKGDVADTIFGTAVADPYRWLEDDKAAQLSRQLYVQTITSGPQDPRTSLSSSSMSTEF